MSNATIRIYYEDNGKPINKVYHVSTAKAIQVDLELSDHGYMKDDELNCPCQRCTK